MSKKSFPDAGLLELYCKVLIQWPCLFETQELATREGKTFVITCGKPDGPPLVLLHGAQSNSAFWMMDIQNWARDFRVYAVDIIGEAGLSAQTRPSLNSASYSNWLADVMDKLSLDSARIIGLSFGGWIAIRFAVHYPQRVKALSLLAPGGIGKQKNFLLKALPFLFLGKWGVKKIQNMVMGKTPNEIPEKYKPLLNLLDQIHTEMRPRAMNLPLLSDFELATIYAPTQVIVGAKDPLIDQIHTCERIKKHIRDLDLVFLPDGHHYIPDQAEVIGNFMRSTATVASDET